MKKAILFDLDGTLTDSFEGVSKCVQLALDHYGIPYASLESLRFFVGPPLRDSFMKVGIPEDQVEEAIRIYRSRYTTVGKFENKPYPGIRELLEKLRSEGHDLYVATSKPEGMSIDILDKFDLTRYFKKVCGASMDSSRETKSSVIAYLLEKIGGSGQAIMVGDTAYDVIGAAEHGIPTIGVTWGYGEVEDMKKSGAIAIAETMEHLYELLQN